MLISINSLSNTKNYLSYFNYLEDVQLLRDNLKVKYRLVIYKLNKE